MATTVTGSAAASKATRRKLIAAAIAIVVLGAIALDTKVVRVGSDEDLRQQAFDPDVFGQNEFPRIRDIVIDRAGAGSDLATALSDDKSAAVGAHGTMAGAFPVMAVQFTGTVGEGKSGVFNVAAEDVPDDVVVRVQTGPAINGTELRDFPGDIEFGAFKNQIEYQNAGAGINRAMSAEVLADLDRDALAGKTVAVTGVFTLINPKNWLVTPVAFEVQ